MSNFIVKIQNIVYNDIMNEKTKSKKLKIFSLFAALIALLFIFAGCDSFLEALLSLLGGGDNTVFDPKTRGDSITSTIFEAHLESIPENERTDILPVDGFETTVDMQNDLKPSEYTSSEKIHLSLRKLLETVVAGKNPIVSEDTENPVRQVWDAARAALNEFIHDDYTEYEIAHTIYDWVVYNVDYDHQLLDDYYNDYASLNDNNPAFHLSGAFLSGLAVCDGISKTFSLLCAMEGIAVERVLGWYPGDGMYVGHAWNKINITVPGAAEQNWFFVDPTFASAAISDNSGNITEYLTHAYFLLSDAQSDDHLQDDSYTVSNGNKNLYQKSQKSPATKYSGVNQGGGGMIYSNCTTEFDYYSQHLNPNENYPSPKVTPSNLKAYIQNYAVPARIQGVEIKLNTTQINHDEMDDRINSALSPLVGTTDTKPVSGRSTWWMYCGKDGNILMLIIVYTHQ